jgi:hypothetical protein
MLASDHFHVSLEKEYDHASIDRSMMTHDSSRFTFVKESADKRKTEQQQRTKL